MAPKRRQCPLALFLLPVQPGQRRVSRIQPLHLRGNRRKVRRVEDRKPLGADGLLTGFGFCHFSNIKEVFTMKKCDCYGDEQNCDLEMELPDDYIDTLYEIYAKETKNPLTKAEWLKTVVS